MEDLLYIIGLAFSGADLTRGLIIAGLVSLMVSTKFDVWRATIFAFIVDKIWPFYAMSFSGYTMEQIQPAINGFIMGIGDDALMHFIRFWGVLLFVAVGYTLRKTLYFTLEPHKKKKFLAKQYQHKGGGHHAPHM